MNNRETQIKRIWQFLENHPEGLTTIEAAYRLRITKLSTRISEMIKAGYPISKTPESCVNEYGVREHWVRYRMVEV